MARFLPSLAFVAVAVLLLGGMHYYVWARLVRDPQLPRGQFGQSAPEQLGELLIVGRWRHDPANSTTVTPGRAGTGSSIAARNMTVR